MLPGSPYALLAEATGPCALLESSMSAGGLGRITLLARNPRAVLVADRRSSRVTTTAGTRDAGGDPISALRSLLSETPEGRWPDEGGVIGALAYDLARPPRGHDDAPLVIAIAVDRLEITAATEPSPKALPEPPRPRRFDLAAVSSLSSLEHRRLVLRIQEHVAAGDIYQANLSQRFRLAWPRGGLALYDRLRRASPAPFSGYFRAAGIEIVSASPERLLKVENGEISTRPIAGTRPRSPDAAQDAALATELLLSEKERAEHLMLLDLARNDLGRVAAFGSVRVDEMMTVESYAQVRHIVSNVRARLAPGKDALDALLALFPGGTITGVPKVRAMEILDELEPVQRGFYTGSLFYATPSGRLDANILIRSAVVADGSLSFHTGGGIVADSDPVLEYAETLHKAEGMRLALEALIASPPALSALEP